MAINRGKVFEDKFKKDFLQIPDANIDRLYDVMMGYKSINQVSDFIGYIYPNQFYFECKSHKGASLPFSCISQYENLKKKVGIKGVRSGIVVWFMDKDKVLYVPTSTLMQLEKDGEKSVGIRHLDKYNIIEIPSVKKRVFLECDYSILKNLKEGE